jgi:phenylacetate-CoA ligase
LSQAEELYAHLPVPLQHSAVTVYGVWWRHRRFGGGFARHRAGFVERERLASSGWHRWQTLRLREIARIAGQAPFYRERWSGQGLEVGDLQRFQLEDLERLPCLSKEEVRRSPEALCPGGRPPRGAMRAQTSGSTGTPLTVYFSAEDLRRAQALRDARYTSFAGVNYSFPRATFSGRRINPDSDSAGPFHRYNAVERQLYFSPYHLGSHTVARYVEALRRHRPIWMTGYAGSIHDLARLALDAGLECPPLRRVVTAAEPVSSRLRTDVERAFGCPVSEEYGLIEEVCLALECERGHLHVSPDAGFVEILDPDGNPVPPGAIGEIVATGFVREVQPFVRYRTGDLAAWDPEPCLCGRSMPVLSTLEGRVDDVIVGPDGRRLGRLSTIPKGLPGVIATQFVQERAGAVTVRVVCEKALEPSLADEIRRRVRDRLGASMEVDVLKHDSLERTARGKVRGVVSKLGH